MDRATLRRLQAGALAVCWLVEPGLLAGQKTTFNPRVALEQGYTDDVDYAGPEDRSDSMTKLSVLLPVLRTWDTGSLDFSYEPAIERYNREEAFDNESHALLFGVRSTPSRKSDLGFTLGYTRSQAQGRAASLDDADFFLTERTDRDLFRSDLTYSQRIGARWNWSGSLGFADSSFEAVEDADPKAVGIEDRMDYGGNAQVGRSVSAHTTLGFGYGWRRFELEESGEETVQTAFFDLNRKVTRKMELGFRIGGFRSTGSAAESTGEGKSSPDDGSRNGVDASLNLKRAYRQVELTFDAAHRPSAGGSLPGTSTDSAVGLGVNSVGTRDWFWSASTRLARRDPTDPSQEEVNSLAAGGSVERSFARVLGVRLSGNYVDQTSDAGALEAAYYTASLGLVWHPLGRTAAAGALSR